MRSFIAWSTTLLLGMASGFFLCMAMISADHHLVPAKAAAAIVCEYSTNWIAVEPEGGPVVVFQGYEVLWLDHEKLIIQLRPLPPQVEQGREVPPPMVEPGGRTT